MFQPRRLAHRTLIAFGIALVAVTGPACGNSDETANVVTPAVEQVRLRTAVAGLDAMAEDLMRQSGIPGMAVAVVHGDQVIYAKGFGVRQIGRPEKVDADTVFALASMSKPLGATAIARQVTLGNTSWETRMRDVFPWFSLADAEDSEQVTVGDMYAHRSGLPDHAGDTLEELSFDTDTILRRLDLLTSRPLRQGFAYTNYGMSAAGFAVAQEAGTDWPSMMQSTLYQPLGMTSSSSRFADFLARSNRAPGHVKEGEAFVLGPERPAGTGEQRWSTAWDTDGQSPSGGANSSANDIARWMSFVLRTHHGSNETISAAAFSPMVTPQATLFEDNPLLGFSRYYGFGFFIDDLPSGARILHHGGAFSWGTGTNFEILPSADVGIVVLTNAWPTGVAESLCRDFLEKVHYGSPSRDWYAFFSEQLANAFAPEGELALQTPPTDPTPPGPLAEYVGSYDSPYHGTAQVVVVGDGLELRLGPEGQAVFPLRHWDGDLFVFSTFNDATGPGSLSKADFADGQLMLEHYNRAEPGTQGLGVFSRVE